MEKKTLLIGIDGGATKVSVWDIKFKKSSGTFSLGTANASILYREIHRYNPDFSPVDLPTQLKERDSEKIQTSVVEDEQAAVYVEACAQAVRAIVRKTTCSDILIGIGMPGLKTPDKRGIAVVANGPRMLHYADNLEKRLADMNIRLQAPISHLGSDADYCGIGENYAEDGKFRKVINAYYLGGGTGVADAMKLDGKLITFDNAKSWLAKTWEMKSAEGLPLERVTSVSGIQKTYAEIALKQVEDLNEKGIFPLQIAQFAKHGEKAALATFELVNRNLAQLIYERIETLSSGWSGIFGFVNPNRAKLNSNHEHLGKLFDRIIIGQRLGDLFDDRIGSEMVKKPILKLVNELIQNSAVLDEPVKKHYSNLELIIKTSQLREAPALGAGIDAFLSK